MYHTYRVHGQLMPIATRGIQSAPVAAAEVRQYGLTKSLVRKAWAEPLAFGARMAREFAYFWEFYPTRLATDNPELRAKMRAKEPRLNAKPVAERGLRDMLSAVSFGCELALALVGLVLAWRTRRREAVLLVSIVLSFALGYALFVGKLRYRVPVLPLVFVFAGVGVNGLGTAYALLRTRANPKSQPTLGPEAAVTGAPGKARD